MQNNVLLLCAAMALAMGTAPAQAAERMGRLTLDIKIDGKGRQQKDATYSTFTTDESVHAAFSLVTSGDPEDTNRLDIAGNAAATQRQVDQAMARTPDTAAQAAMVERARIAMAACKGDVGCMSQAAQALGQQTASWSALPPDNSANEGRYLTFATPNTSQCKGEFNARIASDTQGKLADVQGLVPFTKRARADYRATDLQASTLCNGMIVLDTRLNRIFAYIPEVEVKGHSVWTEGTRTTLDADGEIRLNQDALVWAARQLQNAPASGTQKTRLKIPTQTALGGTGEKTIDVQITWRFDGR